MPRNKTTKAVLDSVTPTQPSSELLKQIAEITATAEKAKQAADELAKKQLEKVLTPQLSKLEKLLAGVCESIITLDQYSTDQAKAYLDNPEFAESIKFLKKRLGTREATASRGSKSETPTRINGAVAYVVKHAKTKLTAEQVLSEVKAINDKFKEETLDTIKEQLNKKAAKGQFVKHSDGTFSAKGQAELL
jgi:hypothetical protein